MEKIKEIIQSLPAFSKKERQRRKALKKEFARNVETGKSMLSTVRSAQLLHTLHTKIAEGALSSGQESTYESGRERTPGLSNPERKPAVLLNAAWFKWAAAAIILFIAGSFWRYYRPAKAAPATALSSITAPTGMTINANNSDHTLAVTLPDHSAVLLSPGSTIRYYASFEPAHRNIQLSGMAVFEVADETARPFTVYAGGINTTALGTRFMVSTLVPGKVQVRLLAGKVVVRPSDNALALKDVYLLPGQQFLLDSRSKVFAVTEYKEDSSGLAAGTRKKTTRPASPQGSPINTSILEFNQEPLTGVLNKIGLQYGVTFRLNGHGFNTMQVTGKFLPSDSLQSVLSMLGSINGLSFTERNDTIVVARVQ